MGAVLGGAAPSLPSSAAGKRRGPLNYSEFQMRAPRHDGVRDGLAMAPPMPISTPAFMPPSDDAIDEMMRDARLAELKTKWQTVGREVCDLPRDREGMLVEISKVADSLRRQGLLMSVAGFSELLARCDVDPDGFPSFPLFLDCLFRQDEDQPTGSSQPNGNSQPDSNSHQPQSNFCMPEYSDEPIRPEPQYHEPQPRPALPSSAVFAPPGGSQRSTPRDYGQPLGSQRGYGQQPPPSSSRSSGGMQMPGGNALPPPRQLTQQTEDAFARYAQQHGGPQQSGIEQRMGEMRLQPAPALRHEPERPYGSQFEPEQQPYAQDGGVQARRAPGSRAPMESKSAAWATSNQYGRYADVLPQGALNSHVGSNAKPANFTRGEPKREANTGFVY